MDEPKEKYPMRINRYLAHKKLCTRREADKMIEKGQVSINGRTAVLGDKVNDGDIVETRFRPRTYRYYAYYKPRDIVTHSAQEEGEEEIADILPVTLKGVFPVGRLDKDSFGLIILTNDGRVTDALLNPAHEHEKEYEVTCATPMPRNFKSKMEAGIDIGGYTTKPCKVEILDTDKFSIILTEGKKHQIRRMCGALGQSTLHLMRTRVMNIRLERLSPGQYRPIVRNELNEFLTSLDLASHNAT